MSLLTPLPGETEPDDGLPVYRQRPRPIGFELAYKLDGATLVIDSTRRVDRVDLATVERVRFAFKPGNIAASGYITELRLTNGKTVTIGDTSWRSMIEVERAGPRYVAFIEALCAAVTRASPDVRFVAGRSALVWLLFSLVGGLAIGVMVYFTLRAWWQGATGAMGIGALLSAIALWQIAPMIWLNRPMALAPGRPPAHLMPAGSPAAPT
jgi:hypothetical protein